MGLTVEMMAEIFNATAQIYEGKIKRFLYEVNYRPIQLVGWLDILHGDFALKIDGWTKRMVEPAFSAHGR